MALGLGSWSLILLLGLVIMYFSSKWATNTAIGISRSLGVKAFAVGFIFISLTTSFPELFITILSSIRGEGGLALGNIFGSNLSNITLVLGLTIIIGGSIYLTKNEVVNLIELMFITTLIPLILIQRGTLSWFYSIILFVLFGYYVYKIKKSNTILGEVVERDYFRFAKNLSIFILSVAFLLLGSELIVRSGIGIANIMGLSTALIGVTIIAIGTSLPELFVGVQSVRKKEYGLALGNLFGSGIMNFTLILGTLFLFNDIVIDLKVIGTSIPYLLLATMFIWYVITKKEVLNTWVGITLLFLYAAFVLQELGLFSFIGI